MADVARPTEMKRALHEITHKHFSGCLWQARVNDRTMVGAMRFPGAATVAIVTCWYKSKLPKRNSGGNWPELEAYEIYVPADMTGTHVGTDEALAALTAKRQAEIAKTARADAGGS